MLRLRIRNNLTWFPSKDENRWVGLVREQNITLVNGCGDCNVQAFDDDHPLFDGKSIASWI